MRLSAATSLAILGLVSTMATAAPVRNTGRIGFGNATVCTAGGCSTRDCATGGCSAQVGHIDQVAASIERQAARMMQFVRANFYYHGRCAFGGQSQHLINDLRALRKSARHIHHVAHNSRGRPFEIRHIRRDVRELDRLVHHVQDLAANMNRLPMARGGRLGPTNRSLPTVAFRPIRNGGHGIAAGGCYPTQTNRWALRQLQRRLAFLSNSVHHLMKDVSVPCGC